MAQVETKMETRRDFLLRSTAILGVAAFCGPAALMAAPPGETMVGDVTPPEDLMREHGVLRRLLLIYDELGSRLRHGSDFPLATLTRASDLIRSFIQDYHEKDEEDYLFTRFNQAGKMVELVKVLYRQHEAGRKVTAQLHQKSTAANLQKPEERVKVADLMSSFNRMYRPHAAWEDTVLYPAFRNVISPKDFDALGDIFEAKEVKLFGKDGFEKIVARVGDLEKTLGIHNLEEFTARI
jgi:hemerythrin-like domain-containing protein